jgi:uncharacterized OB-fold protein
MTPYQKPLPAPDPDSQPFWEGCRAHRLLLQRCTACGRCRFPAAPFCPDCQSRESEWVAASGRGTVFSWIVVRHPVPKDVYAGDVPYVVALVELAEGVRMATNIVGCAPEAVVAGLPVEVTFEDVTAEITLPRFRPAAPPA